jgi:hypothetical protein
MGAMTTAQEEPEELDELTNEEMAELDRRAVEADAHPERLIPNDEVLQPRVNSDRARGTPGAARGYVS